MIEINTDKCEKCAHNSICKNSGYINKLIDLQKMIEYKAEFCTININLMCEYYKEENSLATVWDGGIRLLNEHAKSSPFDTNLAKACCCAMPAITGSTECCKGCSNNPTKINMATNTVEDISLNTASSLTMTDKGIKLE